MRQLIHLPENFNPETDIIDYNKRHKDKYLWVVHSIIFNGFLNYKDENGKVNLNMDLLYKFLGSNYAKKVIDQLVQSGVIEVWKHYQPNVFSKAYRLTEKYANARIEPRYTDKATYTKKLEKFRESHLKDVIRQSPNILHEFNNLTRLHIRREEAERYVRDNYSDNIDAFNSRMLAIHYLDNLHKADFRDGNYKIDFFFKVKGGRVYTPYTSCPKDLEQFLYFDKYGDLIEADAKNSQLVFANKLLNLESQGIDNERFNSILNNIKVLVLEGGGYRILTDRKNHSTPPLPTSHLYDVYFEYNYLISKGWDYVISQGKAYEVMMHLTNYNGKSYGHSKDERNQFKGSFFGGLFYNRFNIGRLTKMERIFLNHFQDEALRLFTAKSIYGNSGFAIKVQRLEGELFHNQIVGLFRKHFKTVPFVIKHDSVKFPIRFADEIIPLLDEILKTHLEDNRLSFKLSY